MDLPLSVLSQIAATLEHQHIRYVLVGSFANLYRSTAESLDHSYLQAWAEKLNLAELLQKALAAVQEDSER
jgi:hypothetical protein